MEKILQSRSIKGWLVNMSTRRWVVSIFILLVALTVRIIHMHEAIQSPLMQDNLPMSDSKYYDKVARGVAEGDLLGDEVFYLAPLYPYVMAISYRLFRSGSVEDGYVYNIKIFRYLQCMLGAISCFLIYWVGTLVMDKRVGLLAGLMAAIYGVFIYYDGIIMPSSLILFLHLLAMLVLILAIQYCLKILWFASGIALGFCAAAHGTAILIFIMVLLWIWIGFPDIKNKNKIIRVLLIIVGFVSIVGVVTIRNYAAGKDFVLLTSNAGKNFYIGNNPHANGSFATGVTQEFSNLWGYNIYYYLDGSKRSKTDVRPSEMSRILARNAITFILKHPLKEAKLIVKKICLFFNAVEIGGKDNFYFAAKYSKVLRWSPLGFGIVVSLGLMGIFNSFRQRRKYLLILLFMLSQIIAFTIMFVLGRYRLVFVACMMLFASLQLIQWKTQLWEKQYKQVLSSLVLLAILMSLIYYPISGFGKNRGLGLQYLRAAESYLELDKPEKAREVLKKAVRADFEPWGKRKRAECYLQLGQVQEYLQNLPEAIKAYEKAIFITNHNELIAEAESRLNILNKKTSATREKL